MGQAGSIIVVEGLEICSSYLDEVEFIKFDSIGRIEDLEDTLLFLTLLGSEDKLGANDRVMLVKSWVDSGPVIIESLSGD